MNAGDREQLVTLLEAVLAGETASGNADSDAARLNAILAGSEEARRYYARYMMVRAMMIQGAAADVRTAAPAAPAAPLRAPTPLYVPPHVDQERAARDEQPVTEDEPEDTSMSLAAAAADSARRASERRARSSGGGRWRLVQFAAAAAVLIVAGTAFVLMRQRQPAPAPVAVATLGRSVDALWRSPAGPVGTVLRPGARVDLKQGLVELMLPGNRGSILVEGPARLSLDAPGSLTLSEGSLFATVHGGGLVVRLPDGVVTDLGTEFGVAVAEDEADASRVDVFVGSVQAEPAGPGAAATKPATPIVLAANQAATFGAGGVARDPDGAMRTRYVRDLRPRPAPLDLADIVAGGTGRTKKAFRGIDPSTGGVDNLEPKADVRGNNTYQRVNSLNAVDGVFVPDGRKGPVQVDSGWHRFPFPPTSNTSFAKAWTSGPMTQARRSTVLGDVDYGTAGHSVLTTHGNSGVTIDLAALRRLHPGMVLTGFHAKVGNNFPDARPDQRLLTDAYVIVNGVARFRRDKFTAADGPAEVAFDLLPSDRFLTLATTDGGDGNEGDWIIWGDPVITLAPAAER